MKKTNYVFSYDFPTVCENIGIAKSRKDEVFGAAKQVCMRALFFDEEIDSKTKAMEVFLNQVQPQNIVEAFWFGCVFMDVWVQCVNVGKKITENSAESEK